MESRRKGESTLLDWERRAGEKERGCTLKGYAKFREKRVKRLQDGSTLRLDRVAMVSTITRRILAAVSKMQHLNLRAHLYENLQYCIPIPCSKTNPSFPPTVSFPTAPSNLSEAMTQHFFSRAVWKIHK